MNEAALVNQPGPRPGIFAELRDRLNGAVSAKRFRVREVPEVNIEAGAGFVRRRHVSTVPIQVQNATTEQH